MQSATVPKPCIGDKVRLKSGGPESTVIARPDSCVTVEWQGESGPETITLPSVCFQPNKV